MIFVRRVLALSALSTLVVASAPAVGGAQTSTVTSVIGSADGLFVDVEVEGEEDPLTFGPAPSVTLPPEGGAVNDEISAAFAEGAGGATLTARLVSVAAEGALGPDGFATAETTVEQLFINAPPENEVVVAQESILGAELISATCEADLDGVSASTTLVNAQFLGEQFEEEPDPNTVIEIPLPEDAGTATVVLNGQEENPDGSLSVIPLAAIVDSEGISAVIEVGPATCGVLEGEPAAELVPAPTAEPLRVTPRFTG